MSETLSSNAVIFAILALNNDIELQKEYIDSSGMSVADKQDEEEILSDLEQAFMEFIGFYKSYTQKDKQLPMIDELLNSE